MILAMLWVLLANAPSKAPSLDGVWRSQGYGDVFEITGPNLKAFEVTATTCLPGLTAVRDDSAIAGREATFRTEGGGEFFVRAGGSGDHRIFHNEGSASDVRFDRLQRLPAACDHPTPNTPEANFEVFARTWAEHYISFDLKKSDWAKVVEANRPKVTSKTTGAELFDIFEGMIAPFNDAHTFINAPDLKRDFRTGRPGMDGLYKNGYMEFRNKVVPALLALTDRAYIRDPLRRWCNDQIQYGHLDNGIGYLRILSFSGYSKQRGFAAGLKALEEALDAIFSDSTIRGLVIDVRINFGGSDPYGLAIASRLANKEYLAYTKVARADPDDRNKWTPGDPSVVRPSSRPAFRGTVVELISPLTVSAGETFTQALMGRAPHITRIGDNTQGVFSDVLGRRLPNGWHFGLPNEVFRTPEGAAFDGAGIPPDIAIPVFADEDVAAGKDPAMAKAPEILSRK